ncbi:putative intracellular multiplication protein IcmG [Piscirickettsia salmonis]|uniref:Type IV secretion system protein IcmG n=2 Tax=Piscirickettsia salmonis TaxID=1238 RepID=A0AAC8VK49_PISSA|nr:hypothetical protein [Piscirickettsia salmonis]AKP72647.1 hypothetical protein PSLF89_505 [Piscirickettsia salmonis LF-89 = ATCC VR-1361]ALB23861.1 type IV secretion system protein IcmG [Piscirickettsia salmonis]ALY03700.1 hypothetical protein AWE47_13220 [Piscirickettsia salmonis]AMA43263.1 hypothetical protein AWJ11_13445 [Piscirickettsia salmonis]AOS35733.1 hypothetical protein AVM72_10565 [Piscirickettsia salmonis]
MASKEERFDFESDDETQENNDLHDDLEESSDVVEPVKEKPLSIIDKLRPRLRFYLLCLVASIVIIFLIHYNYRMMFPEKKPSKSAKEQGFVFAKNNNQLDSRKKYNIADKKKDKNINNTNEVKYNNVSDNLSDKLPINVNNENIKNNISENNDKFLSKINLILNSINEIKIDNKSSKNNILKLNQSDVDQITDSIKKELSASQNEIDSYIKRDNQINDNNKMIINKLNQVLAEVAKENKNYAYLIAKSNNNFDKLTLRAIITGRAWLVNKTGKTITVKKGDFLNGYGKVMTIDDKGQQVVTSSGYIFK